MWEHLTWWIWKRTHVYRIRNVPHLIAWLELYWTPITGDRSPNNIQNWLVGLDLQRKHLGMPFGTWASKLIDLLHQHRNLETNQERADQIELGLLQNNSIEEEFFSRAQ